MSLLFFDTTLRDGEQAPGNTMDPEDKLRIALALERIGVDIIEAGFPISSPKDMEACKLISHHITRATVLGLARCNKEDIDAAYDAFRDAKFPSVHLFIPGSDLHIQQKLKTDRDGALAMMRDSLAYGRQFFKRIFFGVEDASRSDPAFMCRIIETAIDYGVEDIALADTVSYFTPNEIYDFTRHVVQKYPEVRFGIHCHNDLGMATANTLFSVRAGISHVQTTVNGIGERAGNAAFEEVVAALLSRPDYFGDVSGLRIDPSQIYSLSQLVYAVLHREPSCEKAVVGVNSFRHEAGIHVKGVIINPLTYELLSPEVFGREREFVYGRHSGNKQKFEEYEKKLREHGI